MSRKPDLPDFLLDDPPPASPARPARPARDDVPGEPGLWIFVLGDMALFGAFFVAFQWQARAEPALFAAASSELIVGVGLVNTLVLLTSSVFVVAAVRAVARGARDRAARALPAALGCAAVFAVLKVGEYVAETGAGNTPATGVFFTYYYVLTGIHLLHVVIGAALLGAAWWGLRPDVHTDVRTGIPTVSARFVEGAGIYWHMVDLLWVVLFTLLYVPRPA